MHVRMLDLEIYSKLEGAGSSTVLDSSVQHASIGDRTWGLPTFRAKNSAIHDEDARVKLEGYAVCRFGGLSSVREIDYFQWGGLDSQWCEKGKRFRGPHISEAIHSMMRRCVVAQNKSIPLWPAAAFCCYDDARTR
jgi:hypothetical protein